MKRRWAAARALAREPGVVGDDLDAERAPSVVASSLDAAARARVDDRRARAGLGQRRGERRRLSAAAAHGTTANERFGRSKPVVTRTGSRRPSRAAMSARDLRRRGRGRARRSPARRASARRRRGGSSRAGSRAPTARRSAPRRRRTGRRATSRDRLEERRRGEALGRDVEQLELARRRARSPRGSRPRPAGR